MGNGWVGPYNPIYVQLSFGKIRFEQIATRRGVSGGVLIHVFFGKVRWAATKTLVIRCIEGIILPSYMGIVISHYKNPY